LKRYLALLVALVLVSSCGGGSEGGSSLAEGDRAPAFTLPSAAGDKVALSDFAGEKPVLMYFSMGPG
jgi:cytochrome oxidase Cu insertion factor (SCO1/SenC/PrrC family)